MSYHNIMICQNHMLFKLMISILYSEMCYWIWKSLTITINYNMCSKILCSCNSLASN